MRHASDVVLVSCMLFLTCFVDDVVLHFIPLSNDYFFCGWTHNLVHTDRNNSDPFAPFGVVLEHSSSFLHRKLAGSTPSCPEFYQHYLSFSVLDFYSFLKVCLGNLLAVVGNLSKVSDLFELSEPWVDEQDFFS
jgi:hypothetical protein